MTARKAPAALAALAAVALVAAGCGARSSGPYTPKGTIACLKSKGFLKVTTSAAKIGPIAAFAEHGGLQARTKNKNVVTIAFAADAADARATEKAYRNAATPFYRARMDEIMQSQHNAVMVWTLAPTQQQIDDVESCLHS